MTGSRPQEVPGPRPTGLRGLVHDLLGIDRGALAILVTVPLVLTLLDYYGMPWQYPQYVPKRPSISGKEMRRHRPPLVHVLDSVELPGPPRLRRWLWWGISCLTLLVLIPMLVGGLLARRSPRALGLRLKGTFGDAWTYAALFVIFFPILWFVSKSEAFRATYPFLRLQASDVATFRAGHVPRDFLMFEAIYCCQFFAIEFFFRGFMVLGLKRSLGWASVLVMLAPYCMIHYYKPMPEALGAIGAGLVLGTLAWRTGTILYGWALHYGVALSMDLLALHHRGLI
jgi:hypothetical protein